jgi:hypothetical protein
MSDFDRVAGAIGARLIAGAVGTAAMTAPSALEARLRKRESSPTRPRPPARFSACSRATRRAPRASRTSSTGRTARPGAARGLIDLAGLRGLPATEVHFAAVWGWSLVMLPALGVAPPVWRQPPADVPIDAGHHLVYAGATSAAVSALR